MPTLRAMPTLPVGCEPEMPPCAALGPRRRLRSGALSPSRALWLFFFEPFCFAVSEDDPPPPPTLTPHIHHRAAAARQRFQTHDSLTAIARVYSGPRSILRAYEMLAAEPSGQAARKVRLHASWSYATGSASILSGPTCAPYMESGGVSVDADTRVITPHVSPAKLGIPAAPLLKTASGCPTGKPYSRASAWVGLRSWAKARQECVDRMARTPNAPNQRNRRLRPVRS